MTSFMGLIRLTENLNTNSVPAPVAAFSADDTTPLNSQVVTFTDASTGTPTSWDWDFGDGSAHSTDQNPTHTYATPGTYTVVLVATNAGGEDTETKTNYITVTLDPTTIAGLQQWLKADAGVYQDSGLTTPAAALNDPVGGMVDQSGNDNNVVQATAGTRLQYIPAVLNGLPMVRAAGANYLQGVLSASLSQPYTVFIVARLESNMIDFNDSVLSDGVANDVMLKQISASPDVWELYAGPAKHMYAAATDTRYQVFTAVYNGASSALYRNGVSIGTGDAGTNAMDGVTLGAKKTGATPWVGNIGERLVYAGVLDAANRGLIEQYLFSRWGVSDYPTSSVVTSPTNLHDNGYAAATTAYYRISSPFARWVFETTATKLHLMTWNTIYGTFPDWTHIGVFVDGSLYTTLACPKTGDNAFFVSLPAGSKTVEFVAGLQTRPIATLLGTFVSSVWFVDGVTAPTAPTAPANRVVVYGDSIAVGADAQYPTSQGWPVLLRADVPVAVEAWGYRSLFEDCPDEAGRIALSTQIASFAPGSVWLAIGTNDYGLNKWTAANFGTAYADLLDKLHADLPGAVIYCQTPIERTSEIANAGGDTLGAYRTQIATACGTRGSWAVLVDGTAAAFPQAPGDLSDGVHPTTAGHALYYAAVKAALGL